MKRIKYIYSNWKLGVHLISRTKRFGVNNKWCSNFDSLFGISFTNKIKLLYPRNFKQNLLMIHFRALACFFLTDKEILLVYRMNREEARRKYLR